MRLRESILDIISTPIKLVQVDVTPEMVHFDKLRDGTWRLIISKSLLEEKTKEPEPELDEDGFMSHEDMIRQMCLPIDEPIGEGV